MENNNVLLNKGNSGIPSVIQESAPIKYCLYARKSSESEERQVRSIDSQIKEMLELAEREGLNIVAIKQESHSAKTTGQRPIFNELISDIKDAKFNGILTWAPDRIARNAGDLGAVVDLMDEKLLLEIRTHGQRFTDNPNEKFLLMILGSQAKLENDNRGINVQRGIRTKCELGLWPTFAPLGYLNQKRMDKKGDVIVDPLRGPVVKQMFEKVANERFSGRKLYHWLRFEINFYTRGNKPIALSGIYKILNNSFYYGAFEYPRGSGKWYEGKHEPLISKELFEQSQKILRRDEITQKSKEFAFTKLMTCGLCGSGVTGQEKFKYRLDGSFNRYIYYGCTRGKDKKCKSIYIREPELIKELLKIIDKVELDMIGMRARIEEEIKRFGKFNISVLGNENSDASSKKVDVRTYAKYLLREGTISEKRELLTLLKSKLIYKNKKIALIS